MMKLPIQIKPDDLTIKQNQICLKYNHQTYFMALPDLEEIKTNNDSLKLMHYLLTSQYSGASHLTIEHDLCTIEMEKSFNHVIIPHDPEPDSSFTILPFSSLASLQWHTIKHVIIDYFVNNEFTVLHLEKDQYSQIWQGFQNEIECCRWGTIDFLNLSKNKRKQEWGKLERQHNGCYGCIENHGIDQFIKCCRFLEVYRHDYINKVYKWVIDTIEDKSMLHGYSQTFSEKSFSPNRLHVHGKNLGNGQARNVIQAYVIDQNNAKYVVYLIIFTQTYRDNYQVKTLYSRKKYYNSRADALEKIKKTGKYNNIKKNYHCHEQNWKIR